MRRCDALFADAARVVRRRIVNNRVVVASSEGRAAVATHEDGRWTLTTNTQGVAYRGAGRPEGSCLVERLVDAAARETGIDPVELRRRNIISPQEMPYRSLVGELYESGDFPRVMDSAMARVD